MNNVIKIVGLFLVPLLAVFFVAAVPAHEASKTQKPVRAFAESHNTNSDNAAFSALEGIINRPALIQAFQGFEIFGQGSRQDIMIIIDFSLPSTEERFFAINPQTGQLLFKKLVAHGQGTGDLYAEKFSNIEGSHQSSLGFFRTAETYSGKHGLSLRLDGLQNELNAAARDRAIVIHAAAYVSHDFIAKNGYLGRSWGCPALPAAGYEEVVKTIAGGALLFIYHPQLSDVSGQL